MGMERYNTKVSSGLATTDWTFALPLAPFRLTDHPWVEFRIFVEAADRQLYMLFTSIDYDHNGRLDKAELQAAFQHAGLTIPSRRLNDFFEDIDHNKDGYISFDEWR
jgi:Ca2+-binding EF-hand superfamily protein